MTNNKPKYDVFTTPIGAAVYPWLNKPDTKFDKNGKYHTGLSVDPSTAEDFIAHLIRSRDNFISTLSAAKQAALNPVPVYTDELTRPVFPEDATDAQKEEIKHNFLPEPTGNILFKTKLRAVVNLEDGTSFTQAPELVFADSDLPVESLITDGSLIRIRGQVIPYTNDAAGTVGITLRPKAVQVVELSNGLTANSGNFWTEFDGS